MGHPGWVIGIFGSQKSPPPLFRNQKSILEYCSRNILEVTTRMELEPKLKLKTRIALEPKLHFLVSELDTPNFIC